MCANAATIGTLGQHDDRCVMLCLGDTAPLADEGVPTELRVFARERDLLLGFTELLVQS